MFRLLLVAMLSLVGSACASSSETIEAGAPDVVIDARYETGRQALKASEGKPHVLWFWAPS